MDFKLLLFNLFFAILAVAAGCVFRAKTEAARLNVVRTVAIATVLVDLSIVPYRVFTDYNFMLNQDLSTDLPIFFCDIMMIVEVVAFCGPRVVKFLKPFAIWGAFLSGVFVLVDPSFYDPRTFFFQFVQFRSIMSHCMLLVLFAFAVSSGFFKIRLKYMWNVLVCVAAMLVYAFIIDFFFSFSVMAKKDPGFVLNALYMQQSPISIRLAVGPVIALFLFSLLFLISFLVELANKRDAGSVFSFYRSHPGGWVRKTVDYFILQKDANMEANI